MIIMSNFKLTEQWLRFIIRLLRDFIGFGDCIGDSLLLCFSVDSDAGRYR